ncbi:ATP-dependent helicase [Caballeronia sp. LZ001]|uniref:ATP-dependent helicase n=1 Tax=Caballeronia sp. LZ001 TaxID=3038553 RepID=UPI002854C7E9|nr:ATP-dependent helicase [Caballeronia sp. LZ001]MDR5803750.1 ATP-dependent helicase [Caballeronia sp. LZ001]
MSEGWSPQKLQFLQATGHVLALGGPGAGKTHVSLVKARDEIRGGALADGQKVLFLSFARATVSRIAEKAAMLVGRDELRQLEINTYHGFTWSILRSHAYLLNGQPNIQLLPPPDAAAHLADIASEDRDAEKERLFYEDGRLHFDLFARMVATLFAKSSKLAHIYSSAYPLIILDEFQDTDADQWALIRLLGDKSRLIALGDPEQRIYEFRGADPARLGEFATEFRAALFDFTGENHRSAGTDITEFGNDLLTGANKGKKYSDVRVLAHRLYYDRSMHFTVKAQVLQALGRISEIPEHSLAILVPSRALMIAVSDYLSRAEDGLPELEHEVAMDAEAPALAAQVIASALERGPTAEVSGGILRALHQHIRGRAGRDKIPRTDLELAGALAGDMAAGKIRGSRRQEIVAECRRLAEDCAAHEFSGNPADDWLAVRNMFAASAAPTLCRVADDAKYLRLLHRGSALRTSLGILWKEQGHYAGAERAIRDALLEQHFAAATTKTKGIHVMTMHKSKGKEFDEVIVYEGRYHSRFMKRPDDTRSVEQEKLALRVAVTRAMRRVTILTPAEDLSGFLF